MMIRCWDTRVQSYLTSASKIFGVARKTRVPAEKCSFRSTKKANMFKEKRLIEKGGGTDYLNPVPLSPQQTKFLSRTYSRCINMPHPYKHTQSHRQKTDILTHSHTLSLSLSLCLSHTHTHTHTLSLSLSHTHTQTHTRALTLSLSLSLSRTQGHV